MGRTLPRGPQAWGRGSGLDTGRSRACSAANPCGRPQAQVSVQGREALEPGGLRQVQRRRTQARGCPGGRRAKQPLITGLRAGIREIPGCGHPSGPDWGCPAGPVCKVTLGSRATGQGEGESKGQMSSRPWLTAPPNPCSPPACLTSEARGTREENGSSASTVISPSLKKMGTNPHSLLLLCFSSFQSAHPSSVLVP